MKLSQITSQPCLFRTKNRLRLKVILVITDIWQNISFTEKRLCTPDLAVSTNQADIAQEDQSCSAGVQQLSEPSASVDLPNQDQPLAFDRTRLSVAVAGYRGPLAGPQQTERLSEVLFSGLPNLHGSLQAQARAAQSGSKEETEKTLSSESGPHSTSDVLGLGCYSSSDEDL